MIGADFASILKSQETNGYVGIGSNAGFGFDLDGLRYDYAVRGIVRSDGGAGLALKFSVWSIADGIGGDIGAGLFNDDMVGLSYNVSLNAKFCF